MTETKGLLGGPASRRGLAAVSFLAAAVVATYYLALVVPRLGRPSGFMEVGFLLVVGATVALLPVLAGLHFLGFAPERFGSWRVPAAAALGVGGLALTPVYGYGLWASIASLVLIARQRRAAGLTVAGKVILAVGVLAVIANGLFTLVAVGLCGPAVLAGVCNA